MKRLGDDLPAIIEAARAAHAQLSWECETCRSPVEAGTAFCGACEQARCNRRLAAEREAAQRAVPEEWTWAHFDAPELAQRCGHAAVAQARAVLDAWWVVLTGASATGKTALGVAMQRARAAATGRAGAFIDCREVSRAAALHRLGADEPRIIATARYAADVLLDELGAGTLVDPIEGIIARRHADHRPTIITTPYDADDLARRYGDGIARRVYERACVIRLGGPR